LSNALGIVIHGTVAVVVLAIARFRRRIDAAGAYDRTQLADSLAFLALTDTAAAIGSNVSREVIDNTVTVVVFTVARLRYTRHAAGTRN